MRKKTIKKPFKTTAPFGVSTKRFCPIGFHPDLDKDGTLNKNKCTLGPGQYNPERFECLHKKYCFGGSRFTLLSYSIPLNFIFLQLEKKNRIRGIF